MGIKRISERIGKVIPNEISKLAAAAQFLELIPVVGQALGLATRVGAGADNFATAFGDDAGIAESISAGAQGVSGQGSDPGRFGTPGGGQRGLFNNIGRGLNFANLLNSLVGGSSGNSAGSTSGMLSQILGRAGQSPSGGTSGLTSGGTFNPRAGAGTRIRGDLADTGTFLTPKELNRQNLLSQLLDTVDLDDEGDLKTGGKIFSALGDLLATANKRTPEEVALLRFPQLEQEQPQPIQLSDIITQNILRGNSLFSASPLRPARPVQQRAGITPRRFF